MSNTAPVGRSTDIVQVDSFTSRPFSGNPAAVCILADAASQPEWWLQDVAREMNLSETAFVIPHDEGFDLRWFTPTAEVALCGHAALASAHVLWEDGHLPADQEAHFHTRSGLIVARRAGELIEMDFPAEEAKAAAVPDGLERALGTALVSVRCGHSYLLVELRDEKTIRTLRPDMSRLAALNAKGIIVTSRAISDRFDFVSRFFAPRAGSPEDPVTGSAHCLLGPFWGERLGKTELTGHQVSHRGGTVRMRLEGDRIWLGGQAVTVMRGRLFG